MTNTIKEGTAKMKSSAQRYHDGDSWDGLCAAFVFRFVGGNASALTAWDAYDASGPRISTLHANAPAGAIGWWKSSGNSPKPGHVAVCLGNDRWAMASGAVTTEWGDNSGSCTWAHYDAARPAMQWVGWTADYVGAQVSGSVVVVKLDGEDPLWRIKGTTRHHLTKAQWVPLKEAGAHAVTVPTKTLKAYSIV